MDSGKEKAIAFVLKGYPRLSETFITNEILLLERLGCNIHIFALRNPGEKKIHENVHRIKAKVTYIPDYFWPNFFLFILSNIRLWRQNPRRYWPAFKYALLRSIRQKSSSTIKRFAQASLMVQQELPGTNVKYFHAHFSHGPTTVAYFASLLTGASYSFSAHAKDIYLQDNEFLAKKIWGAKFAVTCTEYNRRHLAAIVGEDAPVYRVYHGIDLDLFNPAKKIARNGAKPEILSIGRFVPKKGFPVLITALGRVKEKGCEFHCNIVGGGELQNELEALARELGLQENISFHGKKSQTELLAFYQTADLFALACEVQEDGDRDGIPNVLVEAMAMKIPVVSTRISGIPELIIHNETGLLVEQKNPEALAEAISSLLQNHELARQLTESGLRKVQEDFDNKRNVTRIAEFLNTALAGKEVSKISELSEIHTDRFFEKPGQVYQQNDAIMG
jgi:glycosyltransferase involved in cell wall biosynthesis